jgi:hypothetical protein
VNYFFSFPNDKRFRSYYKNKLPCNRRANFAPRCFSVAFPAPETPFCPRDRNESTECVSLLTYVRRTSTVVPSMHIFSAACDLFYSLPSSFPLPLLLAFPPCRVVQMCICPCQRSKGLIKARLPTGGSSLCPFLLYLHERRAQCPRSPNPKISRYKLTTLVRKREGKSKTQCSLDTERLSSPRKQLILVFPFPLGGDRISGADKGEKAPHLGRSGPLRVLAFSYKEGER